MSIVLSNYNVTGDCSNTISGAVYFEISGTTPGFVVSCLNTPCVIPPTIVSVPPYIFSYYGLSADTYFLEIKDSASNSYIQSVYISSGTTAIIDSSDTDCGLNNGTVTGFTSGVYGQAEFSLYDGDDNFIVSADTPNDYYEFQGLSAGTYYIVANDGGGCTGITASVVINSSNAFTFGAYVVDDGSCIGGPSGKIFLTGLTLPVSAYSINWLTNVSGQTGTTVTGLTSGSYNVEITDPNGCQATNSFTVTSVDPIGSAGFIVISQPSCFGSDGEVEFIITGGTAPYYFSASTGQVEITFSQSAVFSGLSSGSYNFLATDAGLCTIYDSISIGTPNSFTTVQVNTTPSYCSSNDGTIQVIVDGGLINNPNLLIGISGTSGTQQFGTIGSPTQTFLGLSNGDYLVTVTSVGCTYTAITSIDSVDLFTVTASTTGTTCGLKNGVLQVTPSTGGTLPYTYTLNGPLGPNPTSVTTFLSTFTNLEGGNYILTVQDSSSPACIQTYPIFIDTSSNVYFNLLTSQPILGNDGTITAYITSGEPPFTYSWSGGSASSQTGSTVTGLTAGTYSLTVTDADNCSYTKTAILTGTKKYSNYRYFNVCDDQFQNSGLISKRDIRAMYLEGFSDLASGNTNCIINDAIFSIYAQVGSQSAQTEFYTSSGATDYPSDILWAQTITDTLNSFYGISGTTVDITNNRIQIYTTCEDIPKNCIVEPINPLQDSQVIVNLVIDYDISCVSCPPPTPSVTPTVTPTISVTPSNTATNTPTPTNTPTNTKTPTVTPTFTPTNTNTPTNTITPTQTPTNTQTNTITPTPTNTNTETPTQTPTPTPTPTNTETPTPTPTPSSTMLNNYMTTQCSNTPGPGGQIVDGNLLSFSGNTFLGDDGNCHYALYPTTGAVTIVPILEFSPYDVSGCDECGQYGCVSWEITDNGNGAKIEFIPCCGETKISPYDMSPNETITICSKIEPIALTESITTINQGICSTCVTPTPTPTPTETPTNTPTFTVTPTNTETPTSTPTETPTNTPTLTVTPSITPSQVPGGFLPIEIAVDSSLSPISGTVWYASSVSFDGTQPYPLGLTWTQLGSVTLAPQCNSSIFVGNIPLFLSTPNVYIQLRTDDSTLIYQTKANILIIGDPCTGSGGDYYTHGFTYGGGSGPTYKMKINSPVLTVSAPPL